MIYSLSIIIRLSMKFLTKINVLVKLVYQRYPSDLEIFQKTAYFPGRLISSKNLYRKIWMKMSLHSVIYLLRFVIIESLFKCLFLLKIAKIIHLLELDNIFQ